MFMRLSSVFLCVILSIGCENKKTDTVAETKSIGDLLDSFNVAAANASFDQYFSYFNDDAVFIGTDATERWDKKAFQIWAKPFFDKKTTWHFTSIDRHISLDASGNRAWFDELLKTQMKICRGSGVLVKKGNEWKIDQYVLSMTIPNQLVDTVVALKSTIEDSLINGMIKK